MAATPAGTSIVEHEVRVAALPETVFAYFTDPSKMVQWMGAEATLEPRPGGVCRIAFQPTGSRVDDVQASLGAGEDAAPAPAGPAVMSGEYVEVDPFSRIELTWGWELEPLGVPPQSTAVEVTFTPVGEETVVRLSHRRIPEAAVSFHEAGWTHYLPRLAVRAGGGDPGPDPWQAPA